MSQSNFLLDYLPSFYQNFMVDENGGSLVTPIFDNYTNAMGDAIFQGQQISRVPFLEQCDPILIELYSTIDVTVDNKYLDGYIINDDIIKMEGLYLDGLFTSPILGSFLIKHNISTHTRYIVFSTSLPLTQSTIFIEKVYREKQILQNVWGNLIDHKRSIPDYNTLTDGFTVDYDFIVGELEAYKNELIALFYSAINGPSIQTMTNGLGIFLGYKYAPFDGVVIDLTTGITIESLDRTQTYTVSVNPRVDLIIGSKVKKYDLLAQPLFTFYDIFSNPAAFTQIILEGQANKYLTLLNIDTSNAEKYAHLTFDSTIAFDDANIYWDMGNGTGVVQDLTGTTTIASYDPNSSVLDRFDTWVSPLFNDQKLYEMFKNLFIIRFPNTAPELILVSYYLNRVKPVWTKYIIKTYSIV